MVSRDTNGVTVRVVHYEGATTETAGLAPCYVTGNRNVIQNALFVGRAKVSALTIPWCTYSEPELAHVGLSARNAEKKGIKVDTFTQGFDGVDRSILEGETNGFVRVHVRKGTATIVGAAIVAANAGDLSSKITLAMTHGLGLKKIASSIHPYSTQAEAIRKVGDLYSRTRLTPRVKSLMRKWLKWTRRGMKARRCAECDRFSQREITLHFWNVSP